MYGLPGWIHNIPTPEEGSSENQAVPHAGSVREADLHVVVVAAPELQIGADGGPECLVPRCWANASPALQRALDDWPALLEIESDPSLDIALDDLYICRMEGRAPSARVDLGQDGEGVQGGQVTVLTPSHDRRLHLNTNSSEKFPLLNPAE